MSETCTCSTYPNAKHNLCLTCLELKFMEMEAQEAEGDEE